jgi:hypothetical protein
MQTMEKNDVQLTVVIRQVRQDVHQDRHQELEGSCERFDDTELRGRADMSIGAATLLTAGVDVDLLPPDDSTPHH